MSKGQKERPVSFGEVLAVREFRALYIGDTVSNAGDMLARVAVTFLVWQQTGDAFLTAATFAVSYAPYLLGSQFLSTLAERYPYRRSIITGDVLRMVLIGLVALPGMPLWAMLVLLFLVAAVNPAERSARSALLAQILEGEKYVTAVSLGGMTRQIAQLSGYFLGGVLAGVNAHVALAVDAGTFALSAALVLIFVRTRPPESSGEERRNLLRETASGIALVFGDKVLRSVALLVFSIAAFTIVPEAAAPAWTDQLHGGSVMQGALMASAPIGAAIGALVLGRFVLPATRQRLIRPFALATPVLLTASLLDPPFPIVIAIAFVVNVAGGVVIALNGLFVQVLPNGYRARAFGVMQTGLMLTQGIAALGSGAIASTSLSVSASVGVWGVAGVIVVGITVLLWPSSSTIEEATRKAKASREAPEQSAKPPAAPPAQPNAARTDSAKAEA